MHFLNKQEARPTGESNGGDGAKGLEKGKHKTRVFFLPHDAGRHEFPGRSTTQPQVLGEMASLTFKGLASHFLAGQAIPVWVSAPVMPDNLKECSRETKE